MGSILTYQSESDNPLFWGNKLFELCGTLNYGEELTLDFSNAKFLRPIDLAICCSSLIHLGTFEGIKLSYIPPSDDTVRDYYKKINFEAFIKGNIEELVYNIYALNKTQLFKVRQDEIYGRLINFSEGLRSRFPDFDCGGLVASLGEILNNVYDHSESEIGNFVVSRLTHNFLNYVVIDRGVGVCSKVNKFFGRKSSRNYNDSNALMWSLIEYNTTERDTKHAGRGLHNVISFLKAAKSMMNIYTNSIKYTIYYDSNTQSPVEQITSNPYNNMIGSIFEIKVRIANLPLIESDEFSNEL